MERTKHRPPAKNPSIACVLPWRKSGLLYCRNEKLFNFCTATRCDDTSAPVKKKIGVNVVEREKKNRRIAEWTQCRTQWRRDTRLQAWTRRHKSQENSPTTWAYGVCLKVGEMTSLYSPNSCKWGFHGPISILLLLLVSVLKPELKPGLSVEAGKVTSCIRAVLYIQTTEKRAPDRKNTFFSVS